MMIPSLCRLVLPQLSYGSIKTCSFEVIRLYTKNHFKQGPLRVRFLQIAGSQIFLADYCTNGTISTECDNMYIFNTHNYFFAHVCTHTCKLHAWICINCLCVTCVRHACDTHEPFNLWVICTVVICYLDLPIYCTAPNILNSMKLKATSQITCDIWLKATELKRKFHWFNFMLYLILLHIHL